MKVTVLKPTEVDVHSIEITIPLRHDGEEGAMPKDFPLRQGNQWCATIHLADGEIEGWPKEKFGRFEIFEKVCDEGLYVLLDDARNVLAIIDQNYVPHGVVPGKYGDYINLEIDGGKVVNLRRTLDFSQFFPATESSDRG